MPRHEWLAKYPAKEMAERMRKADNIVPLVFILICSVLLLMLVY